MCFEFIAERWEHKINSSLVYLWNVLRRRCVTLVGKGENVLCNPNKSNVIFLETTPKAGVCWRDWSALKKQWIYFENLTLAVPEISSLIVHSANKPQGCCNKPWIHTLRKECSYQKYMLANLKSQQEFKKDFSAQLADLRSSKIKALLILIIFHTYAPVVAQIWFII